MKTYISLLRGINVSGQNKLRMTELVRLYEVLGFFNVLSYIQSGNVIFDCEEQNPAPLAKAIETGITRTLGGSVRVLLRNKDRFRQIIDGNPFINKRNEDPEKLHVTFLSDPPAEAKLCNLPASGGDRFAKERLATTLDSKTGIADEFLVYDTEIYLFCPNGYGRTKFSNTFFERKLNISATTRNWKTVNALYEIAKQR
jgi:uncharacterized protein (DUF1697 family)